MRRYNSERKNKMICCICGNTIKPIWNDKGSWDKGHNPFPIIPVCKDNGCRCCDDCNKKLVLPLRLVGAGIRIQNIPDTIFRIMKYGATLDKQFKKQIKQVIGEIPNA